MSGHDREAFVMDDAYAYLDRDMEPERMLAFEEASTADLEVARLLAEAQSARSLFRRAAAEARPDARDWSRIDRAMMDAIAQQEQPRRAPGAGWFQSFGRALVLATAAAAVVVAAGFAWQQWAAPKSASPRAESVASTDAASIESVAVGEILTTSRFSRTINVADARLTLAPSSAAKLSRADDTTTQVDVMTGEVAFEVGKRAPGQVFRVQAAGVTVTVVGTRFVVAVDHLTQDVSVAVDEGRVRVTRGDEESTLGAGDSWSTVEAAVSSKKRAVEQAQAAVPVTARGPEAEASPRRAGGVEVAAAVKPPRKARKKRRASSRSVTRIAADTGPRVREIEVVNPEVRILGGTDPGQPSVDDPQLRRILRRIGEVPAQQSMDALRQWLRLHPVSSHRERAARALARLQTL